MKGVRAPHASVSEQDTLESQRGRGESILLLGGSGFLGRHIVAQLQTAGYTNITVASRSPMQHQSTGVQYVSGIDITDGENLKNFLHGYDVVINCAGYISFLRKDLGILNKINVQGAINVLRACEKAQVKRLIHVSSTSALGCRVGGAPDECFEFDWESAPHLPYSRSKHGANETIRSSELATNIVFPSLILGAGDPGTQQMLDFSRKSVLMVPPGCNAVIDVRDVARGIVQVLMKALPKEDYILAGESVAFADMCAHAAMLQGKKPWVIGLPRFFAPFAGGMARLLEGFGLPVPAEIVFWSFRDRAFDTCRAKKHLQFEPEYTWQQTLSWAMGRES